MKIYLLACNLFLGLTILLSLNCYGQVVKVIYEATAVKVENENTQTQHVMSEIAKQSNEALKNIDFFAISNNQWNHVFYEKAMSDDSRIGDWSQVAVSIAIDSDQFFIDYLNQKAYYESSLVNKIRSVELSNVEWSISSDSKEILGYTCYKAKAKIIDSQSEGKLVPPMEAWFAPKLSFRGGPTAYANLPGMILEVTSSKITFMAKKIEFIEKDILKIPQYKSDNILTHEQWTSYFEKNTPRPALRKQ